MKYFGKNDSITADRGSLISGYLKNVETSALYQLFLNGCEVKESGSERKASFCFSKDILSEQYNALSIKKFHQIRTENLLILHG